MSLHNPIWRILAVVTAMVTAPVASGQVYHPFGEGLEINPDWQFFAPVDIEEFTEQSPRQRSNTGWFATYDRTNLWVSRPNVEASADTGDFGWGNRFDVGFMDGDKRSGWLLSFRSMTGPNVYDRVLQERVIRQNPADTGDPANPVLPPYDGNDPQLGFRAYVLGDSLNVAGLTNFELNKTWRRTPYRYGGILEPMVGFKYSTFNDEALNQQYALDATQLIETLTTDFTRTKNQMVGGQMGARYFNNSGRWTMSGELRVFGMANFQTRDYERRVIVTDETAATRVFTFSNNNDIYNTNSEFVFGFETRAELAYAVTNFFQIRGGVDVIDLASGIWRGQNPGFGETGNSDQDVQIAGFSLGITINR